MPKDEEVLLSAYPELRRSSKTISSFMIDDLACSHAQLRGDKQQLEITL